MKTTSAHPTGNNSSLTPFPSSEGSGVGADRTVSARNAPPKTTPVTSPAVIYPDALPQARRPTHPSAKPRHAYSAALIARTHRGAGPARVPAAFNASATPFWSVLAAVSASGAASSPVTPSSGTRPLAVTRPSAMPTQTSSDQHTVLQVSATSGREPATVPNPAATSSRASCSRSPSRIASQATRSSVTQGLRGGSGFGLGLGRRAAPRTMSPWTSRNRPAY